MIDGGNQRSIVMSNIVDLNEFRKKKEEQAEKEMAGDLYRLLSELMLDDEPVIISMVDSDGNETENGNEKDSDESLSPEIFFIIVAAIFSDIF